MSEGLRVNLIKRFTAVHKGKYCYDKVVYKDSRSKVCIVCVEHGEFWQDPSNHISGAGCPECWKIRKAQIVRAKLAEASKYFPLRAASVHNAKYNYFESEYTGANNLVTVICPSHGKFQISPKHHIRGSGCSKCADEAGAIARRGSLANFISSAVRVHSSVYAYFNTVYVDNRTPLTVTCPNHGDFELWPMSHLRGSGCPTCLNKSNYGFDKKKPALLYYLKINDGQAYKIGITNHSVAERFKKYDLPKIEILNLQKFTVGSEAQKEERKILNKFKDFKWEGEDLLNSGNTELFDRDVLCLGS